MNANLEKYCLDVCCRDKYPHLLEERRYEFALLRNIPKETYVELKKTVASLGGVMRYRSSGQMGFSLPPQSYKDLLCWTEANGLSVHTLFDHLDRLRYFYRVPQKELGRYCFVDLPQRQNWRQFNPNARLWTHLETLDTVGLKGIFVRAGSVLRCEKGDEKEYYKVSDSGKIHLLQTTRAALNLAAQYFVQKNAYWIEHKQTCVIPTKTAGVMPEDLFYGLVRMRPFWEVPHGLLAFAKEDFAVVREFLKVIKIDLVRASRLVELPGDKSRTGGTPLLALEEVGSARVSAIASIISKLGGEVTMDADFLKVAASGKNFKVGFIGSDEAMFHNETLFVPITDVGDASAFQTCAASLSLRLGRGKKGVDKLISLHWDIQNEVDAQFIVSTFIRYIEDEKFAADLLSIDTKLRTIRRWYDDCIATTDFDSKEGFGLHDLLRSVSRRLSGI